MPNERVEKDGIRFIQKFVIMEFYCAAVVIAGGGMAYGAQSGRWGQALMYSGILLTGTLFMMFMIYRCAERRCRKFSPSQLRVKAQINRGTQ